MGDKFSDLRRDLDQRLDEMRPEGNAIRERTREDLERELAASDATLAELRRARALTQKELAEGLDVSQAQVSRIEKQADLLLSTLVSYVEAIGGQLELAPGSLTVPRCTSQSARSRNPPDDIHPSN